MLARIKTFHLSNYQNNAYKKKQTSLARTKESMTLSLE